MCKNKNLFLVRKCFTFLKKFSEKYSQGTLLSLETENFKISFAFWLKFCSIFSRIKVETFENCRKIGKKECRESWKIIMPK